jgi:hypothetical protein
MDTGNADDDTSTVKQPWFDDKARRNALKSANRARVVIFELQTKLETFGLSMRDTHCPPNIDTDADPEGMYYRFTGQCRSGSTRATYGPNGLDHTANRLDEIVRALARLGVKR